MDQNPIEHADEAGLRRVLQQYAHARERWPKRAAWPAERQRRDYQARVALARVLMRSGREHDAAGEPDKAMKCYKEAAKQLERALRDETDAASRYATTWALAEALHTIGRDCDARRDRRTGALITIDISRIRGVSPEERLRYAGRPLPWREEQLPVIQAACQATRRAVRFYDTIRDWSGLPGGSEECHALNHRAGAALAAIEASKRLLNFRGTLLKVGTGSPLPPEMLPETRPDKDRDRANYESYNYCARLPGESPTPIRVKPLPLAPAVVRWLVRVDAYVREVPTKTNGSADEATLALQAAELLYKARQFDAPARSLYRLVPPERFSARRRLKDIVMRFPRSRAAKEAARSLINSYQIELDLTGFKKVVGWVKRNLGQSVPGLCGPFTGCGYVCRQPGGLSCFHLSADRLHDMAMRASLNLTGRGWRKADVRLCRLRARVAAEQYFGGTKRAMAELPVETIGAALLCAKLMSYSQGFDLLAAGSTAYNFGIDRAESARIWTGGCIIRARFLDRVHAAFTADPALALLFTSEAFAADIAAGAIALRTVVAAFAEAGVAAPAFAASLGYFETMTQARGSAAMIQAQRDYFGAHTYRRVDSPEVAVHSEWSELAKLPLRS